MTDVNVQNVDATFTFEPEVITASPGVVAAARQQAEDVARLKELLKPIILSILEDELSTHKRMRG
jgi:hypothetical protein